MSLNQPLANLLHEMSRVMDLLGEDSFRSAAHARAARTIESLSDDIETVAKDRARLTSLDGIGAKMADKIAEYCASGRITEHSEMMAKVPAGLLEVMQVPGLGPKTVKAMWGIGITDIASLKKAIEDGSLLKLPRMGEKAVAKIKDSLAFAAASGERTWLGKAAAVADLVAGRMRELPGVARVEAAGSLRRGKDTIGDIDILVAMKEGKDLAARQTAVGEAFRGMPGVMQVISGGEGKSSVRFSLESGQGRWGTTPNAEKGESIPAPPAGGPSIQIDLRVLPITSWGSGLMYFTGSKEHNVRLRERAIKMGYTLSEWGLFPLDKEETPPHTRGVKAVAAGTEEGVFEALGLPWIPPEAREDRGEIDAKGPWELVRVEDIRAELHAHTTASDGFLSIEELALEAKKRGFHTIAVTDHSQSSTIANGLKPDRLRKHIEAVREADAKIEGIKILAGSEVDILADGSLDYKDELLAELDVVVASPHAGLTQDSATATARLIRAISHPLVHILGHPTGRLVLRRPGLSPDMGALLAAAKEHDVALEINAHWMRLDLRDVHVRAAMEAGCKIAIDCDDHERGDFDNLRFGVMTARRGWVTAERCINTWTAKKLHAWLKSKGR